jgi:hypothetical protein
MTYDLRRLRRKGLIHRIPKTHRYTATTYGLKVACFAAKLYLSILRPEWPALMLADDSLPRPLRDALDHLDTRSARFTRVRPLPLEKLASIFTNQTDGRCLGAMSRRSGYAAKADNHSDISSRL